MAKREKKNRTRVHLDIETTNEAAKQEYESGAIKKKFHIKDLKHVSAKTENQKKAIEAFTKGNHLFMHGLAGTGKTFLGMFLGLKEVLQETTPYQKLIIVRSIVPVREIGFLPGTEEEKNEIYEMPYVALCNELFEVKKSYENLKAGGYIQFMSTSFLRGLTFNNAIILVDEIQNLSDEEFNTISTRVGINSKIIFSGDGNQRDLKKNGLGKNIKIFKRMGNVSFIEFDVNDIVRSGFCRDYIIERDFVENFDS